MDEGIDLRGYVRMAIRRWWLIVGPVLVAVAGVLVAGLCSTRMYQAAVIVASPGSGWTPGAQSEPPYGTRIVNQKYLDLATSDDVLGELLSRSLPELRNVSTRTALQAMLACDGKPDGDTVRLVVRSADAHRAAELANLWAETYVAKANQLYSIGNNPSVQALEQQLAQKEKVLDEAEQALVEYQGHNRAAILEAQLASKQQDLRDCLVEQREAGRLVGTLSTLRTRVAEQPRTAPPHLGDALAALALQAQTLTMGTGPSAQVHSSPVVVLSSTDDGPVQDDLASAVQLGHGVGVQLQVSEDGLRSSWQTAGELTTFLDALAATLSAWGDQAAARASALEAEVLTLQQDLQRAQAGGRHLADARDAARRANEVLTRQLDEAQAAAQDVRVRARVASVAAVPEAPLPRVRLLSVMMAACLAGALGVCVICLQEWWRAGGAKSLGGRECGKADAAQA